MSIDEQIKEIVKEEVKGIFGLIDSLPELISIDEAANICGCDKSVINSLIQESSVNNFPVVKLSQRIIRIDKGRFSIWLRNGGINGINK